MNFRGSTSRSITALCAASFWSCVLLAGCNHIPGRPAPGPEVIRPEALVDFATLYKDNCAGCHGRSGSHGPAIPLANPIFLSVIGEDDLGDTIMRGVPHGLMPAFGKAFGGTLTDQQIAALAGGIVREWGRPAEAAGLNLPSYEATLTGDAARGQTSYAAACARCHGANGEGDAKTKTGSITDPTYLALVTDQYLRNLIVGGRPDEKMPDFRSDTSQPLTDQQITDIVAWLASKRVADPGQPYSSSGSKSE